MLFKHLFLEIILILLLKASSRLSQLSFVVVIKELAVSLCFIAGLLSILGRLWFPLAKRPVHASRLLLESFNILDVIRQSHVVLLMGCRPVLVEIMSIVLSWILVARPVLELELQA